MTSPGSFADQLRQHMAQLRPSPVITHGQRAFHVPCDLQSATHVFVRHDAHRSPLKPPYDGPFCVLTRSAKFFKVDLGSRTDNISIDRLKAAFIEGPSLPPSPTPLPNLLWLQQLHLSTVSLRLHLLSCPPHRHLELCHQSRPDYSFSSSPLFHRGRSLGGGSTVATRLPCLISIVIWTFLHDTSVYTS